MTRSKQTRRLWLPKGLSWHWKFSTSCSNWERLGWSCFVTIFIRFFQSVEWDFSKERKKNEREILRRENMSKSEKRLKSILFIRPTLILKLFLWHNVQISDYTPVFITFRKCNHFCFDCAILKKKYCIWFARPNQNAIKKMQSLIAILQMTS